MVHYCNMRCCASFDDTLRKAVEHLSWALCPGKCPKYCRSRWTRYNESIDWCELAANICNGMLFDELMERTIGNPQAQPRHAQPSRQQGAVVARRPLLQDPMAHWQKIAMEEAGLVMVKSDRANNNCSGEHLKAAGSEQQEDCSDKPNWAEINARKRAEAASWVVTKPGPRLVAIKTVARHPLSLMGHFLSVSSPAWEKQQQRLALNGCKRSYRILEVKRNLIFSRV